MSDLICRKTMMRCNTPGTCSPHGGCRDDRYAALSAKDARIAELERALSLTSGAYRQCVSEVSATPSEDGGEVVGYAFHNPETGMEWNENHPRESGEVPDAGRCQRMTLAKFREKYGYGEHDTTGEAQPARLNRRAIPEGLLERIIAPPVDGERSSYERTSAVLELRALLGKDEGGQ